MIGYSITKAELYKKVEKAVPGWIKRAKKRTAECADAKAHVGNPFWSEVKDFFRTLQGESKCAFCERKLTVGAIGAYEHDVEHFRPKGRVNPWPVPSDLAAQGITCAPPPDNNKGYYLLPYHLLNYSVACKTCNEGLKRDYFPIQGKYKLTGTNPENLQTEKPLLIFPIGENDRPAQLIGFNGASPFPLSSDQFKKERALVTIAFFRLDDGIGRKDIFVERCRIVVTLKMLLEKLDGSSAEDKRDALDLIAGYTSPKAPHTGCAMSFMELFKSNRDGALRYYREAVEFIKRNS